MDFEHLLDQAIDMLRRHRRLTYRTLKRQFKLDDQMLEELKDELLFSQPVVDEHDRGLFWTGETAAPDADTRHREIAENRFQTLLLAVMTVESELLYQRGRPPQSTYIFKHALIQEAAYHSLLKRTRQCIHEQVIEALNVHFSEFVEHQPELLAYHATEAGLNEQAITYWQRAGTKAFERPVYVEAIAHFRQGLELLMKLPDIANRPHDELAFRLSLCNALKAVRGFAAPEVES